MNYNIDNIVNTAIVLIIIATIAATIFAGVVIYFSYEIISSFFAIV